MRTMALVREEASSQELIQKEGVPRTRGRTRLVREHYTWLVIIFLMIALPVLVFGQTITTDKVDYNPGDVVKASGKGWRANEQIDLVLKELVYNNPGTTATVTTDGLGNFSTDLYNVVEADRGAFFLLKGTGRTSHHESTITFNDKGGDYGIDFSAYDPVHYMRVTYNDYLARFGSLPSGRMVSPLQDPSYEDPGTTDHGKTHESLMPEGLGLGQIVAYEFFIRADARGNCTNDVVRFTGNWLTETTNGSAFGFDGNLGVVAAFVDTSPDAGFIDPGNNARVINKSWTLNGNTIEGTVDVAGMDPGDEIEVEVWVVLQPTIAAKTGGNVKAFMTTAASIGTCEPSKINTGNQEVPLLQSGNFFTSDVDVAITKQDLGADIVHVGDNIVYEIAVTNAGPAVANTIVVTDVLDPNTTYVGPPTFTDTQGASWTFLQTGNTLTFSSNFLNVGETAIIQFPVRVNNSAPKTGTGGEGVCTTGADLCNRVTVTTISNDTNPNNNSDSEPTGVTCTNLNVTSNVVPVNCFGASTGSIDITVSGGVAPYTFSWSNGATTEDISSLAAGTYTVSIHDASGCSGTGTFTISQPASALSLVTSFTNESCNQNNDGTASVTASGGTAPYTYLWSNGRTTPSISGLTAGSYSVTVTDSKNCTAPASVTITEPILVTVNASSTNVSCFGLANGTISASASAGASITVNGQPYVAGALFGPGVYSIVATAPNGNGNGFCTASTSVTITEPILVTVNASSTNVSCNGLADGIISASASAGASITVNGQPYVAGALFGPGVYSIVATALNGNGNGFCTASTSVTINEPILVTVNASSTNVSCNGLADGTISASASAGASITVNGQPYVAGALFGPGVYSIVATAPNGNGNGFCTASTSVTITEPILVTVNASSTNVSCNGLADGTISASASAGASITVNGQPYVAGALFGPGVYSIVATAPNGNGNGFCTATTSVTITEPILVTVNASSTNVSCNGLADGTISASASAGASITVNGQPYVAGALFGPGVYSIVATAPNGNGNGFCTATTSVTITEPILVTVNASSTNVSCNGLADGTISASASAGASITVNGQPYVAGALFGPGVYSIVATAPNGNGNGFCTASTSVTITEPILVTVNASSTNVSCNGLADGTISASASAGASITVNGQPYVAGALFGPGVYSIVATAPNGNGNGFCTATTSVTITEPILVTVSASSTNVSCNGLADGTISASASAGASITVNGQPYVAGALFGPGVYSIVATAPNGNGNGFCTASTSVTINEPILVTVSASSTNVSCNGLADGTMSASASAGASITVNGQPYVAGALFGPGVYSIVATAPNGNGNGFCTATTSVTITEPILVTVNASSTNVSCNGLADGTISASASAGASITVNGQPYVAGALFGPGVYSIVATAPNGNGNGFCTATTSVTITEPILVTVNASSTNVSCNGLADGTISASASAGASITVNGQPYVAGALFGPGVYSIVATAPNGNGNGFCTATTSVTITQPTAIGITAVSTLVTGFRCADGTITVTATGGTPPYTYSLNGGAYQTDATFTGLVVGTYTVSAKDSHGCVMSTTVKVDMKVCGGTTVTQGGWGAKCSGGNWGCYLITNFAANFPTGLIVGNYSSGKYVLLTSASAIQGLLPSSGTPAVLTKGWTNPTKGKLNNTLVGQAVALTLNLKFFGIGDLVITSGSFAGTSAQQMLDIANAVLSGSSSSYSPSSVNEALDGINRNFDGGKIDNGFLACPCNSLNVASRDGIVEETPGPVNDFVTISTYPNPFVDKVKIEFTVEETSYINLQLFNSSGVNMGTLFDGTAEKGVRYSTEFTSSMPGMYIYRMSTSNGILSGKVMQIR